MARHGENKDSMKSLLVLLVGVLLGVGLTLSLPVLAGGPYPDLPATGYPGESYSPGDGSRHFRDGVWYGGPEPTPKPPPTVTPFLIPPC